MFLLLYNDLENIINFSDTLGLNVENKYYLKILEGDNLGTDNISFSRVNNDIIIWVDKIKYGAIAFK